MIEKECCPNNKCNLPAIALYGTHWHESLDHPKCPITNWITAEDMVGIKERIAEAKGFMKKEIKFNEKT